MPFLSVVAMVATIIFLWTSAPQQTGYTIFTCSTPKNKKTAAVTAA
jgi:hypothetical protein